MDCPNFITNSSTQKKPPLEAVSLRLCFSGNYINASGDISSGFGIGDSALVCVLLVWELLHPFIIDGSIVLSISLPFTGGLSHGIARGVPGGARLGVRPRRVGL